MDPYPLFLSSLFVANNVIVMHPSIHVNIMNDFTLFYYIKQTHPDNVNLYRNFVQHVL